MLCPDELNRLTEHGGSALINQAVTAKTKSWIGSKAAGGIASTTLKPQQQLRDITPLALLHTRLGYQFSGSGNCLCCSLERTSLLLNAKGDDWLGSFFLNFLSQLRMPHRLTPKTDDDHRKYIGIEGKPGEHTLGQLSICLHIRTAGVDDHIHRSLHLVCHNPGCLTRTATGGKHQNEITHPTSPLRALVSQKLHQRASCQSSSSYLRSPPTRLRWDTHPPFPIGSVAVPMHSPY